uniref:Uncharacterized protein n=1 Tax=Steinernema glaseri TaxID=37863 RepID=A0A1I8A9Q6_9BILA
MIFSKCLRSCVRRPDGRYTGDLQLARSTALQSIPSPRSLRSSALITFPFSPLTLYFIVDKCRPLAGAPKPRSSLAFGAGPIAAPLGRLQRGRRRVAAIPACPT